MECNTVTDILKKKEVILQNAKNVEAHGGNMERIMIFRGPLHDKIGVIFAVPLSLSK